MSTDELAQAEGKVVKVGWDQLSNPTPGWAKYIFRGILYASGVWAVVSPSITEIDPITLSAINKYLLLANAVVNVTIRFFGWDYKTDRG